ncbi:MAG: hypothetical protein ABI120_03450 [Gemmatimonadaceae bacterium]
MDVSCAELPKLRRAFPGANEIVYDYAKSVVVSFSMSERGYEAIVSLAIFPDAVRLYFDKSLPDPKRLLEGIGTKVRSVIIKDASDLDDGDIHTLIVAAITHSGVTFARTTSTRSTGMSIKTDSTKRKARNRPRRGEDAASVTPPPPPLAPPSESRPQ